VEPETITLGGQTFTVRPLTIGDVEDISALNAGILEDAATPQQVTARNWRVRREVIARAIQSDHPDMTADKIRDLPGNGKEIIDAHEKVLEVAGLIEPGAKPGEAKAETA